MSASVLVGLVLAFATALTAVVANLMRHVGARNVPDVRFAAPIRTSLPLFRSRWYVLGLAMAIVSWGLHVGALALAPISLAQSVIAGGLVFLAVIADRVFHLHVTRREWIGVAMAAVGLAFLAATLDGTADQAHSDAATGTLLTYVAIATAIGVAAAIAAHRSTMVGPVLGLATGVMWGASDVTIKALTADFDQGFVGAIADPLVLVVVTLSVVSLVVSARSLQLGPPVTVIALTAAAGNVVTILSGPVVFDEPFPSDAPSVVMRVAALVLVVVATVLTPPRAEAQAVSH